MDFTGFRMISRRRFLKGMTLAATGLVVTPALAGAKKVGDMVGRRGLGRGNAMPGRIILLHDDNLSHNDVVDMDRAEIVVAQGVKALAGITDIGEAFESLFPGITPSSKIAIKVNLISDTDTRWETARGVVSGLSMMFGRTYDVSNVTLFDHWSMSGHGYTAARFTFNGNTANLQSTSECDSGIYPVPGRQLSSWIADAEFLINMPVLKDHSSNQLTLAFKNHYGSVYPHSMCGQITSMLELNTHTQIKDKTSLVLLDGIFGIWRGGPHGYPQDWQTFPDENTPNSLFLSTDPVTTEYWGRETINAERASRGYGTYPATYVETAAGSPYDLGIADPVQMDALTLYLDRITIELLSSPSSVARGEVLEYRVRVANTDSSYGAELDRVRLEIGGPAQKTMNLFSRHVVLNPGQSVTDWVQINVPGNAPLGTYNLRTIVSYENADLDRCSFACEVTA